MAQQSHYWAYTLRKTITQKTTCTPMFIAALFIVARTWKQPRCTSTDEQKKKFWFIYTMEYYSAIKRNEIGSFVLIWMALDSVIQNEVSQKEKNKYYILTHIYEKSGERVQMNLFAGQEQRHRCIEQTYGHSRGSGGGR